MYKSANLYILFALLCLNVLVSGAPEPLYFKTDIPKNLPAGEDYEISTLFKMPSDENSLVFYVTTDYNSPLKYVMLKSDSLSESLTFSLVDSINLSGDVFRVKIKGAALYHESICQLLVGFSARGSESSEIGLYYSYDQMGYIEEIASDEVSFYTPQTTAGKCLELTGNSSLSFSNLFSDDQQKAGVEFWLKTNIHNEDFFEVTETNSAGKDSLLDLVISNFGYITSTDLLNATVETEFFTGDDNWNHIFIEYDNTLGTFKLYCNDSLSIVFESEDFLVLEDLGVEFFTTDTRDYVYVDNFRVWDYSGNCEDIIAQKNFNSVSVNDAELLGAYQFSSKSQLTSDDIELDNIELVESDAPIFSKAPLISVAIYDNVNQISITLNELSSIESLTLQKSYTGSSYEDIQEITALNSEQIKYTVSDIDASDNEIIYYRVKQVTDDEDVVYSNSVKVGRGKQIHFEVEQNYPNPFNPSTTISVNVQKGAEFQIRIYDVVGKLVTKLFDGYLNEGIHEFEFIAKNLPSGIYFAEVKSERELDVMKMILAK